MKQLFPNQCLGTFLYANTKTLQWAIALLLLVLCAANKSAKLDLELTSWIQQSPRINSELDFVSANNGEGTGSTSQLLIQTPRNKAHGNVLTVEALMTHLEAMAIATHITIDLYDVSWSLRDLCFSPTLPDYESFDASVSLDRMMPCIIKTPLDCFWEGAKIHGPDEPILGFKKWTSLNPMPMVEAYQRNHPHASFPYATLIDWMRRVGIDTGYQYKPCLDPTDPNCPDTAPNKKSSSAPNVGATVTGGCYGIATNQMHWKEEEIVGGIVRNKSGHIIRANALQSTIQLMGERDLYDYWRKTDKVLDVNNWSQDKAQNVLDTWQRRFKEELTQFTRTSASSSSQNIHAMTSKSMLEPIDSSLVLDPINSAFCFTLMTILTCIAFPNFTHSSKSSPTNLSESEKKVSLEDGVSRDSTRTDTISRLHVIFVAFCLSGWVCITFIASLGLSSFMGLQFTMATTQILPPLAFYYGFNQMIMIANIFSQNYGSEQYLVDITTKSLNEMIPVVTIESLTSIIALLVATIIPVQATRELAFQAITFILLATLVAVILLPSILTAFLKRYAPKQQVKSEGTFSHNLMFQSCDSGQPKSRTSSPSKFTLRSKKVSNNQETRSDVSHLEDHIFSRIQNDLKNLQADTHQISSKVTDINFSTHLGSDGLRTSIKLSTKHSQSAQNGSLLSRTTSKIPPTTEDVTNTHYDAHLKSALPDLLANCTPMPIDAPPSSTDCLSSKPNIDEFDSKEKIPSAPHCRDGISKPEPFFIRIYIESITDNKFIQIMICLLKLIMIVAMLVYAPKVKYGLQLKDIVAKSTEKYESFQVQEKYFPVYNVFAVTKGNFDYPANQRLLLEYYKSIEQVEGIVSDKSRPKFWLIAFRDWLLEIQTKFDIDRSKSAITGETGWTSEASDASKLAYKLLAQTGRVDNPIDKGLVESNRLVDAGGIINPKAFYHYLSAWVANDAFTYTNTEANFKPEPKMRNTDNPEDLKVEKARPLTYAQMPFVLSLPTSRDNLKTISEIRSISQAFEQLNLPNFPTGIPFIFWDQFINLDLMLSIAVSIGLVSILIVIGLSTQDFSVAAIITIPIMVTLLELYCFMGYASIPFNNILAVLLISTLGTSTLQTVHYTTYFAFKDGSSISRAQEALRCRSRIVITSLALLFLCFIVFYHSKIDFMIRYSILLLGLIVLNAINSLLLTPIILSIFGPKYSKPFYCAEHEQKDIVKSSRKVHPKPEQKYKHRNKKRGYPRIQSEISLSTISEEPQSEALVHDLKLDLSIKCY